MAPHPSSSAVKAFYRTAGQRLVVPDYYPAAIREHLAAEEKLVVRLLNAGKYTAVIEVGCMHGCLHFPALLQAGVRYLGIDIVPESIIAFQEHLRTRRDTTGLAEARVLDVSELSLIQTDFIGRRVLVVFPFNSFGNLEHPTVALAEVAKCGYDPLILTYRADEVSSAVRAEYYQRCGYTGIQHIVSDQGTCFRAVEGLCTWAYNRVWLIDQLRTAAFVCEEYSLASVGIAYLGRAARKACGIEACTPVAD